MTTTLTAPSLRVQVRWIIRRDLFPALLIDDEAFAEPWDEIAFRKRLYRHNTIGVVAGCGRGIAGFAVYELSKTRLHILRVAVAVDARRRGVGTQLVAWMVERAAQAGVARVAVDVDERNLPGQVFLKECGFRAVNVLRSLAGEVAYRMVYRVTQETMR